ncbi:hypothetical protein H2200_005114 [Cladophialophora chaetospira]|uniref:Uncharacterized protein n=1 Tax=Cladophialophora chaetospira TaxID=386627 RepID=A0AA39CJA2_9EURO|nr:hypothetical protein H2200_005114 [Cladophialophora chaetospira]
MEGRSSVAWRKPELAANEQPLFGAPPSKYELGSESSQSRGTPTEYDSISATNTSESRKHGPRSDDGKQVLQVEKTISPLPQATQLPLVTEQQEDEIVPSAAQLMTDINVMKARERELADTIDADESLRRLKAEHAALQQRIAVAEMQAAEMRRKHGAGGSA